MNGHRDGVASASAEWLLRAFPPSADVFSAARGRWQAREAAELAAVLRYPTAVDDALLELCGPGGSGRLDETVGAGGTADAAPWRTWVDEVVVSWAAALLADPSLAAAAASAAGAVLDGSLGSPTSADLAAGGLLRHPDLLAPVAALHRASLDLALAAPAA
jgi:hypothetical protein